MSDNHTAASTEKPSLLSNILAIIGLIILVIIIIWGLVHLAELSSGWFSSLFAGSAPTLQIEAPADAISGAPVNISWNYSPATDETATGTYAFLYQCQQAVQFAVINTSNNTASGIQCGTAANVTPIGGAIQMLPILSGTSSASVPFSIIFTPATGASVQGSATMTIHPGSAQAGGQTTQPATQTTTPTKTTTTKPAPVTVARSYSPADLSVRIVAESVDQYGNGVVTFNIANIGGTVSSAYYFSAQMPTRTPLPYTSSLQAPLAPGSYIVDTLRFSPAVSGTFSVAIGARDLDQANDYASVWINAPMNYNGYNNPHDVYYQSQPYTY